MKKLLLILLLLPIILAAQHRPTSGNASTLLGLDTGDFVRTIPELKILSEGVANDLLKFNGDGTMSPVAPPLQTLKFNSISDVLLISSVDTGHISFGHDHATEYTPLAKVNTGISTLSYNESDKVLQFTSGVTGATNQMALEDWTPVINNTGVLITNGKAVYLSGVQGDSISEVTLATNASSSIANRTIGLVTSDIADGGFGFVTTRGRVRGINTSSLTFLGAVYLGTNGDLTMTKPVFPASQVIMGGLIKSHATEGIFQVGLARLPATSITTKSYPFTSNGVAAGTYYNAGYYEAPATDANLTQSSLTQTLGTVDIPYAAHCFMVFGAASVDAGVVGLVVKGTSITDTKVVTPGDADTISFDITAHSLNDFVDSKKFISQVTYELITISGSPTTYSLDFNYGWDKYEDFGNQNYTLAGYESVGTGGATDNSFELILYHHSDQDWTYAATGFEPGGTILFSYNSVYGTIDNVASGEPILLKVTPINEVIDGADSEGLVIKIITTANGTVQNMVTHLGVVFN